MTFGFRYGQANDKRKAEYFFDFFGHQAKETDLVASQLLPKDIQFLQTICAINMPLVGSEYRPDFLYVSAVCAIRDFCAWQQRGTNLIEKPKLLKSSYK